jgi:hypothetical protein
MCGSGINSEFPHASASNRENNIYISYFDVMLKDL